MCLSKYRLTQSFRIFTQTPYKLWLMLGWLACNYSIYHFVPSFKHKCYISGFTIYQQYIYNQRGLVNDSQCLCFVLITFLSLFGPGNSSAFINTESHYTLFYIYHIQQFLPFFLGYPICSTPISIKIDAKHSLRTMFILFASMKRLSKWSLTEPSPSLFLLLLSIHGRTLGHLDFICQ